MHGWQWDYLSGYGARESANAGNSAGESVFFFCDQSVLRFRHISTERETATAIVFKRDARPEPAAPKLSSGRRIDLVRRSK